MGIAIRNRIFALSPLQSHASPEAVRVRATVGGKSINKLRELARAVVLTREELGSLVPRRTFPREDIRVLSSTRDRGFHDGWNIAGTSGFGCGLAFAALGIRVNCSFVI